jgi:hypothetical protein
MVDNVAAVIDGVDAVGTGDDAKIVVAAAAAAVVVDDDDNGDIDLVDVVDSVAIHFEKAPPKPNDFSISYSVHYYCCHCVVDHYVNLDDYAVESSLDVHNDSSKHQQDLLVE